MNTRRIVTIPSLPARPADGHKGMYGTVLVVAGGRGMAGAAALVGASALRSGAGRVRVACPAEVQPTVASFEPCYMTWPLPDDGRGAIRFPEARADLERLLEAADVLAIGDGVNTDIAGAAGIGIDTVFVASGLRVPATGGGDSRAAMLDRRHLAELFASAKRRPLGAMRALTWSSGVAT